MAVSLNPRAEHMLARIKTVSIYSVAELLLLVLIAVQCARLFWGMVTPLGPVGDYKALDRIRIASPGPALGAFDPFFRQPPGTQAPANVTALDIRLYGVMGNQATGGGSAILSTANGEQRSVLVGEEIMPGVTLVAIGFDYVTIGRNGATEQLYLDQTPAAAPGAAPVGPPSQPVQPPPVMVPTVQATPTPAPPPPPPQPQGSQ
jgi:general secretion pathway protein C